MQEKYLQDLHTSCETVFTGHPPLALHHKQNSNTASITLKCDITIRLPDYQLDNFLTKYEIEFIQNAYNPSTILQTKMLWKQTGVYRKRNKIKAANEY